MAIFKFMLGNLKKRKSYSIVICILLFIVGVILMTTISTLDDAGKAYENAINNIKGPQLIYWPKGNSFNKELVDWFKKRDDIECVRIRKIESSNGAAFRYKGKMLYSSGDNFMLQYYLKDNMRIIDSIHTSKRILSKGEVYLPYIYKLQNHVSRGDKIDFVFGSNKLSFKVAGFVEEPIAGGQLIGFKRFFASRADMKRFIKLCGKNAYCYQNMEVRIKNYNAEKADKINKKFMQKYDSSIDYVNSYSSMKNSYEILPNIVATILMTFAVLLGIIIIIIIRYSILATIEADFLNIGIVKALGFTPKMVKASISGQYVLLGLMSGILSLAVSAFATPFLGKLILKSSGLYYSSKLSVGGSIITLIVIIFVTLIFSYITANRTKNITPVRAIANGAAPVYFSSRLNLKLEHMKVIPFNTRMALKQVMTKFKRYAFLILISAILAFMLSSTLGFGKFINGDKAIYVLGLQLPDIELDASTKPAAEKIVKKIEKDYKVDWVMYQKTTQLQAEGERTTVNVENDFYTGGELTTLEGRYPKHNNEVAISNLLRKKFHKGVGDYLTIKDSKNKEHEFIISGVFQTVSEGGSMIRILGSGIKVLKPDFKLNEAYIKLKNNKNLNKIIEQMKHKYTGYEEISNERKETKDQVDAVRNIFSAISKLILVFTAAVISFIIFLIMKITIYGEINEIGIYKAIGFSAARIRLQLAIRFLLVTVIGAIIGALIMALCGSKLFSLALSGAGVAEVTLTLNAFNTLGSIIFIAILALISSYLSSGNTKKVSTYELINE